METNFSDEDAVEVLRKILGTMLGWNIPSNMNAQAGPIFNGPVNFISNCTIETFNGVELKSKPLKSIEQLQQQPQMAQDAKECMPKPLFDANTMEYYILYKNKTNEVLKAMHEEIDGKQGRIVAVVTYSFVKAGILSKKPNWRAILHEFGQVISKSYFNECFKKPFYEDETEALIKKISQIIKDE